MDGQRDPHRNHVHRFQQHRHNDRGIGNRQIRRIKFQMAAALIVGNPIRSRSPALMTGLSAPVRIRIAKAQFRPADDGGKADHRRGKHRDRTSNRILSPSETHANIIA